MTEKPAKPAASEPTSSRKASTRRRKPDQGEISKRAYFIPRRGRMRSARKLAACGARAGDCLRTRAPLILVWARGRRGACGQLASAPTV
jgi:hypothetical protein